MRKLEEEILTAKNDIIFKELFSKKGNEDLLEDLLESILNHKVKCKSVIKEARIGQLRPDEKYGSLDIRVLLENNIEVDLEMQIVDKKHTLERASYYASLLTLEGLKPTDDYSKMKPKIVIFLMDYELFDIEKAVVNTFTCLEQDHTIEADKLKKCYFVDLTKVDKTKNNEKLKKWLLFFNNNKKELSKMKEDKIIEKAEQELNYLTGDAEVKRLAELRQRWLRDELRMKELVENAKNDLKRAKRINKIEIVKVREESLKQTSLQIAKNMLNKNINLDTIIECTKLSREEILNLK